MVKLRQLLTTFSLFIILGACAFAQTNLTQIRDTVTNSDGTPFNGTVVITFTGSTNTSTSSISPLSTSARIYNGILSVLLVPSTTAGPGSFYQAVYHSNDGTTTWTETWSVPVSTTPVTLTTVRTSSNLGGTWGNPGGSSTGSNTTYATLPIAMTAVTGLSSQLSSLTSSVATLNTSTAAATSNITSLQSTVSGLSSTVTSNNSALTTLNSTVTGLSTTSSANSSSLTSLTSVVNGLIPTLNSNGSALTSLTSTVGGLNSTVAAHSTSLTGLNNTVGTLGTSVTNLQNSVSSLSAAITSSGTTVPYLFVDGETPAGTLDGSNTAFTLASLPTPVSSLELYRNGLVQTSGVDYTISGRSVTFLAGSIPMATDVLQAFYRIVGSSGTVVFTDSETPTGTTDGSNLTFKLAFTPTPSISLKLYKNGMLLRQSADYTLSGATITFVSGSTPRSGDALSAFYRH